MSAIAATVIGVAALLGVLVFAVVRPRRLPEAVAAVPAAAVLLALGIVSPEQARVTVVELGPTLGFLAAVLVIAHLAEADGVFDWIGQLLARRSRGSAQRLLLLVFAAAAGITATLSLDATAVLLTPVVFTTVRRLRLRPAPHLYATAHLANTASVLLPISNLTNLLAFHASSLSFLTFTALMIAPWLAAISMEYLVFRVFFRDQLRQRVTGPDDRPSSAPVTSLVLIGLTLVGFAAAPALSVPTWTIAAVGALAMAARALARHQRSLGRIVLETNPLFVLFVAALGVVVDGATGHGLRQQLSDLLPVGDSWLTLLLLALTAAAMANLVNNLPATLVMLSALAASGSPSPVAILAVLIGVNIGPNLTYTGSLATLLWRRVLLRRRYPPSLRVFTRLGLLSVPAALVAAVTALWLVAGAFSVR